MHRVGNIKQRRALTQRGFSLVELMVALAIGAVLSLAAINILLYSEQRMAHSRERGELMQSALAVSEMLRQASWKAGHATASQQPNNPLAISGVAPSMRLHSGYVLDQSGMFTQRNCVGNKRTRGNNIIQTTDQWYARNSTDQSMHNQSSLSLYCRPGLGAGSELGERVNGIAFDFLVSDTRQMAQNSSRFERSTLARDAFYRRAVVAELLLITDDRLNKSATAVSAFDWQGFIPASTQSSIAWQLTLPIAIDLQ